MKLAVVLFNLGGPDGPEAVEPFLRNLFSDPAIIRAPSFVRLPLARFIAGRRAPIAREIYGRIGGGSPILKETEDQARALEAALQDGLPGARVFIVMRYWHPRAAETVKAVKAFAPDRIVLLPLYPQYSTTTSASSLAEWALAARDAGLAAPATTLCCYPSEPDFVAAHADLLAEALARVPAGAMARVLFSAHGLPERVVKAGDPYQHQVERSAAAVAAALGARMPEWRVTYQSRVGPLKWIGPETSAEIEAAARAGLAVVVVPIAFVSEHSETLVELDIEYRHLAEAAGAVAYIRVPALAAHTKFIDSLAGLVARFAEAGGVRSEADTRLCPGTYRGCPCAGTRSAV